MADEKPTESAAAKARREAHREACVLEAPGCHWPEFHENNPRCRYWHLAIDRAIEAARTEEREIAEANLRAAIVNANSAGKAWDEVEKARAEGERAGQRSGIGIALSVLGVSHDEFKRLLDMGAMDSGLSYEQLFGCAPKVKSLSENLAQPRLDNDVGQRFMRHVRTKGLAISVTVAQRRIE